MTERFPWEANDGKKKSILHWRIKIEGTQDMETPIRKQDQFQTEVGRKVFREKIRRKSIQIKKYAL